MNKTTGYYYYSDARVDRIYKHTNLYIGVGKNEYRVLNNKSNVLLYYLST